MKNSQGSILLNTLFRLAIAFAFASADELESPFTVVETATDTYCGMGERQRNGLINAGFSRITCPFGVAIAGTADYHTDYMLFMANVMGHLLDADEDGVVDDPKVADALRAVNGGPVLGGALTGQEESNIDDMSSNGWAYGFTAQAWWANDFEEAKRTLTEETFHMHSHFGLSVVYPDALGVEGDWESSVLCRQTKAVLCCDPGWTHWENECPSDGSCGSEMTNFPPRGECNYPSCTCTEFYFIISQVILGGIDDNSLEGVLGEEFKEMFDDDSIAAIKNISQIDGHYTAKYVPTPTSPSPTPSPNCSGKLSLFRSMMSFIENIIFG